MFEWIAVKIIGLTGLTGKLAESLEFWIYDTLKITVIMLGVIFAVSYFFPTFIIFGQITNLKPPFERRLLERSLLFILFIE